MNDYLGNIIVRNRSMVDSIQPRLPSLFEPLHPAADLLPEFIDSYEGRDGEITHSAERAKSIDLHESSPDPFFIQPPESKMILAPLPSRNNEGQRQPQDDSDGGRLHIDSPMKENQGKESIIDKPIREEPSIPLSKQASLPEHILKQQTILIPGVDRYQFLSQSKSDPQIKVHFHSEGVKNPGSNQISESMQSVRVNIGRIEVRAIMPEPSKPRKTSVPKAPTLSLEEYLKQRSGGQR